MVEQGSMWDELMQVVPNAMATVTGEAKKYRTAIENLSETLMQDLVPAALTAVAAMSGFMGGPAAVAMIETAMARVEKAADKVKKTIGGIAPKTDETKDAVSEAATAMAGAFGSFTAKAKADVIDLKSVTAESMKSTVVELQDQIAEATEMTRMAIEQSLAEWEMRWGGFISTMQGVQQMITDVWVTFRQGVGDAVAAAIVEGKSLGDSLKTVFKNIATHVISTLIQMGVERIALALVYGTANLQEATQRMATLAATTYAGAFASAVATPIIGPMIAPGIASAAVATMLAKAASAGAAGAGVGAAVGALHGGMESVPAESTYLLQRGERVLSPRQNRDLEEFMGRGSGVVVNELNIMPKSSIDEALFEKPVSWWSDLTRERILPALNALGRSGFKTAVAYDSMAVD